MTALSRCFSALAFLGIGEDARISFELIGRGGGIRTHDPLLPKQMRYQAALRPDDSSSVTASSVLR